MDILLKIMGVIDVIGGILVLLAFSHIILQIIAFILIFKGIISLIS